MENTTYDAWGEVLSGATKSKFQYTGQEKDLESGLNYYNARYYDSNIRRFTQADPIIQDVYNPQSLNRYSYVVNNPLRYTDPSGSYFVVNPSGKTVYSDTPYYKTPEVKKPSVIDQYLAPVKNVLGMNTSKQSFSNGGGSLSNSSISTNPKTPAFSPPGVGVMMNMKSGNQNKGNIQWFINSVNTGGLMDYKNKKKYGPDANLYEPFGNYNYGAVGAAVGLPEWLVLGGAGSQQLLNNLGNATDNIDNTKADFQPGIPFLLSPHMDYKEDQYWIHQGYKFGQQMLDRIK